MSDAERSPASEPVPGSESTRNGTGRGVSGHADPEGEAPWALPMVVRAERGPAPELPRVLEASARSVVMLLAEADAVPDHPWAGSINRWLRGRIRKVSRRARGVAWTRVCELPGVTATVGSAQVRALVPCPMDAVAPEVKKLQVQGLVTAGVLPIAAPPGFDGLVISVNPDFTLSPGKAAAQVAHASNVAWMEAAVADRNAWRDRGFPLCVVRPDPANFATVARRAPISIRDAGFTEIPAGSLTCVASWSGP